MWKALPVSFQKCPGLSAGSLTGESSRRELEGGLDVLARLRAAFLAGIHGYIRCLRAPDPLTSEDTGQTRKSAHVSATKQNQSF